MFDTATDLSNGDDANTALVAWQSLEKRVANNRRTHAIVLVREGAVLQRLDRVDEAATAIRAGLVDLPTADATLAADRYLAHMQLGQIASSDLDYTDAAVEFTAAGKEAGSDAERLAALAAFVETDMFIDPDAASAAQGRAEAMLTTAQTPKETRATFAELRGLLLLNTGKFKEAKAASMRAVELFGGLTPATKLNDVQARSDVAIAAMLQGDADTAHEYMAYTGAGRLTTGSFDPAIVMKAPDCGGDAGLKPDDMAVVEFSLANNGSVLATTPIYSTRNGAVALAFARAVQAWSWTPAQVKQLPPFFRFFARVEMRCSTSFDRPSARDAVRQSFDAWLARQGATIPDAPASDALALPQQRAVLTTALASDPNGAAALVASRAILVNRVAPRDERHIVAQRALGVADRLHVPPLARLWLDLENRETDGSAFGKKWARELTTMISESPYRDDPSAHAALLLLVSNTLRGDAERAMLDQVANEASLPANDPFRVAALVRIASLDQQKGDVGAARDAYQQTGLSAEQCALVDSPPHLLSSGGSYPLEATRWGFEGWTQTQFDVDADGKVTNGRAIISYPPFVFTKAGTATMTGAKYSKTFRPDGGLGCGGLSARVRFVWPK
jgi:Flp pilus assembly protein TadD